MARFVTSIPRECPGCGEDRPDDFILVTGVVRPSMDGSEWDVTLVSADPGTLADLSAAQRERAMDRLADMAHTAERMARHG